MFLTSLALAFCTLPTTDHTTGDFAGWVYQEGGGDFPIRIHLSRNSTSSFDASMDLPAHDIVRRKLSVEEVEDGLRLSSTITPELAFEASWSRPHVEGECSVAGERLGRFTLDLSPLPLPDVEPERYADLVGSYRFPSGRAVLISARFWGELVYVDTGSGRIGTLFPIDETHFFAGSAMYVPGPVTALVSFDEDGISWQTPGAAPERGSAIELQESELSFESSSVELSGTLVRPTGEDELPAVVVLGGSGWRTRDSVRREVLIWASAGFAAFSYDKRGHGASGGEPSVPFVTTANDARAAAWMLAERADVDGDRIGVTGTSRGGWFAPLAAAGESPFAHCILFVAPAISPADQETTRRLNVMRRAGHTEEEIRRAAAYLDEMWRFCGPSSDADRFRRAHEAITDEPWAALIDATGPDDEDWTWARMNMLHDPLPVLERLTVPVLAIYGELDANVVPDDNAPLLRRALTKAGNRDFEIDVVPGVDHSLRLVGENARMGWSHEARGYSPAMWRRVLTWARVRNRR